MRTRSKIGFGVLLLLLLVAGGIVLCFFCGGVTHRELKATVTDESARIQSHVDVRADELSAKLDRLEAKLDKLIEMATPRLPDGMSPAP